MTTRVLRTSSSCSFRASRKFLCRTALVSLANCRQEWWQLHAAANALPPTLGPSRSINTGHVSFFDELNDSESHVRRHEVRARRFRPRYRDPHEPCHPCEGRGQLRLSGPRILSGRLIAPSSLVSVLCCCDCWCLPRTTIFRRCSSTHRSQHLHGDLLER